VYEELTGPFSSRPYDIYLRSFKTHIAMDIWNQKVIFFLNKILLCIFREFLMIFIVLIYFLT